LASCALEAISAEGYKHFACEGAEDEETSRLVYVSIKELARRPHIIKTLALHHEPATWRGIETVKTSSGYEGIHVQPVEGLDGIKSLNPGEAMPVYLWHALIKQLGQDYNLAAFNYDWRRWGDLFYVEEVLGEFRLNVEDAYEKSGQKVVLVGHSMGAQVCTYCLGALGKAWTQTYVDDLVLVGPAPMGSPSMFAAYANGPSSIAHSSAIPVAEFYESKLGDVTSTWSCMISELPVPVGDVDTFKGSQPFATTPSKLYYAADVGEFLQDLAACHEKDEKDPAALRARSESAHGKVRGWLEEQGFVNTKKLWKPGYQTAPRHYAGVAHMAKSMTAPACRTHFVYSNRVKTLTSVDFPSEDLRQKATLAQFEPGDDTVTAASIQKLADAWREAGTDVCMHKCPGAVHHKELISCKFTLQLLQNVMEGYVTQGDPNDESEVSESDNDAVLC